MPETKALRIRASLKTSTAIHPRSRYCCSLVFFFLLFFVLGHAGLVDELSPRPGITHRRFRDQRRCGGRSTAELKGKAPRAVFKSGVNKP